MANRYWVGANTVKTFSIAAQEDAPQEVFFRPDGLKMYVIGSTGDAVYEYDLSTAWNITSASYLQQYSVNTREATPFGLFFKPDGTKMYICGSNSVAVIEYDLSTAWNVTTASYLRQRSVSAQDTSPRSVFFKSDGLKMYVLGSFNDRVYEYDLGTAWDVSTASFLQQYSVATQETLPQGLFFKPDGTKMYVAGTSGVDVNEYDLATAWNVTTASYLQNYSVAIQEPTPNGLFFKSDGTQMYIVGPDNDRVVSYPLSTAWDLASINPDYWDGTAGTKWATTSGGTGGASVPTSSDNVFFDANSGAGIFVIAAPEPAPVYPANALNFTGFTGTFNLQFNLDLYGDLTLGTSTLYTWGTSSRFNFMGTSTVYSNGVVLSPAELRVQAGASLTLGDALTSGTIGTSFTVNGGTFSTANYAFSVGQLSAPSVSGSVINLGSSTVTLRSTSPVAFDTGFPPTFNAGTSQINCTSGTPSPFNGGGVTFYNVAFTATSSSSSNVINAANTFNNLSFTPPSSTGIRPVVLGDSQIVNGTLTCAGASAIRRISVFSSALGTVRTITAAAVSADHCDFRDITIAGAAAPISPTGAGDCGGSSGITFPAAKTVYRVGTQTQWVGSASWALTSGGTGNNANFPLAQDTAVIDNATTLTGTLVSGSLAYNYPALDASTRTTGITLAFDFAVSRYGSLLLGSGVTVSGGTAQTFSGRGTMVLASAGKTVTFPLVVNAVTGTLQLGSALTASSTLTHTSGTLDANNYNVTCTTFASSGSATRTLTMGSGLWTMSSTGTVWNTATTTGLTFNKDTANILLSNTTTSARTFSGGGLSFNKLTIGGATGISTLTLTGANSFTELASTKTVAHTITLSSNQGTIDTWSVTGTVGNVVTVNSSSAGTRRTFGLTNSTAGTVNYLAVRDIGVDQADTFYVGDNSTNNGNNLNVIFSSIPVPASTGNMFMLFQ